MRTIPFLVLWLDGAGIRLDRYRVGIRRRQCQMDIVRSRKLRVDSRRVNIYGR